MRAATPVRPPPERTVIRPQAGFQETVLASPADIVVAGGIAGAGKSWTLLLEPLRHATNAGFGAVVFRRTYPQITHEGGLWDESERVYAPANAVQRLGALEWRFPSGATVKFAHLQHEQDRWAWKGAQIPLIEFDQLEDFTSSQFWFMLSRNRSACGVRPYMRASCNPVPEDDPIGGWLHQLILWWLDETTGLPRWDRSGRLRWFVRPEETLVWADSREDLVSRYPDLDAKSLTFVPGRLEDNPALVKANPGYRANLLALPLVERERLLGGNWNARPTAGKVFNRAWFPIVEASPREARRVRFWDKACLVAGTLVETVCGPVLIEDVRAGDAVLTRCGYRMVRRAGQTGTAPVCSVALANGRVLTGTLDHRVWTENRGWVTLAETLRSDYNLYLWDAEDRRGDPTPRSSSTRESRIPGDRGSGTSRAATMTRFIVRSGARIMVRSRLDMSSTMSTETGITTILPTLCACRKRRTSGSTWPSGTRRAQVDGTSESGRRGCRCLVDVGGLGGPEGGLTAWGAERPAGRRACEGNTTVACACVVARSSETDVAVYDLDVDDAHEFFANGVLVHNSSEGTGDWSAGALLAEAGGIYYVEDVVRGQWSALARNRVIRQCAETDGYEVAVWLEQEGGAGGKESAELSIRELAGYTVRAEPVSGDKLTRASPFSAQAEAGNVRLLSGGWNRAFLEELHAFDGSGRGHDDQVDSVSAAFRKLALGSGCAPTIGVLGAESTARRVTMRWR